MNELCRSGAASMPDPSPSNQIKTPIKTPSPSVASVSTSMGDNNLRELIRSVVREELAKCGIGIAPSHPAVIVVADVVRQEIRQAMSAPEPLRQAISAPEPRTQLMPQLDYATTLRCHMPTAPTAATMPPPRRTPNRNLLALCHKGNSRLVRKSARPTCGAPRTTSHCAITVASQGMFIDVAPTAKSGYQDSHQPPAILVLANGPSPFLSTSPRVSLPRRVVHHVRRHQPAMLRPPVVITEAPSPRREN